MLADESGLPAGFYRRAGHTPRTQDESEYAHGVVRGARKASLISRLVLVVLLAAGLAAARPVAAAGGSVQPGQAGQAGHSPQAVVNPLVRSPELNSQVSAVAISPQSSVLRVFVRTPSNHLAHDWFAGSWHREDILTTVQIITGPAAVYDVCGASSPSEPTTTCCSSGPPTARPVGRCKPRRQLVQRAVGDHRHRWRRAGLRPRRGLHAMASLVLGRRLGLAPDLGYSHVRQLAGGGIRPDPQRALDIHRRLLRRGHPSLSRNQLA